MKTMRDGESALFISAWHVIHNLSRRGDHRTLGEFTESIQTFGQQKRLLLFAVDCAFVVRAFAKSHTGTLMAAFTESLGWPVSNVYVRVLHPDGFENRFKHEQPREVRQWLRKPADERTSDSISTKNSSARLYHLEDEG